MKPANTAKHSPLIRDWPAIRPAEAKWRHERAVFKRAMREAGWTMDGFTEKKHA
jgi:hypothetical protein